MFVARNVSKLSGTDENIAITIMTSIVYMSQLPVGQARDNRETELVNGPPDYGPTLSRFVNFGGFTVISIASPPIRCYK